MSFKENRTLNIDIKPSILELREFNEIQAYIQTAFEPFDLSFSLVEMGLLSNIGVGRIYIWAKKNTNFEVLFNEYDTLVQRFKNRTEFRGGVSNFKEWYKRGVWLVTDKGTSNNYYYDTFDYAWRKKRDVRSPDKYGNNSDLTENLIKDYLEAYLNEIVEFELGKHPYYGIAILPLGYYEKGTKELKPLANLYLHFCTLKPFDDEFLVGFVRNFLLIFYRQYGGILIDEAVQEIISVNADEQNDLVPTKMPHRNGTARYKELIPFFKHIQINSKECLEKYEEKILADFLLILLYQKEITRGNITIRFRDFDEFYNPGLPKTELLSTISKEKFCCILTVRHIIHVMHILFNYSLVTIYNLLKDRELSNKNLNEYSDSPYHYFLNNAFLSTTKRLSHSTDLRNRLYNDASPRERDFLNRCVEKIKRDLPSELYTKFEALSLTSLESTVKNKITFTNKLD